MAGRAVKLAVVHLVAFNLGIKCRRGLALIYMAFFAVRLNSAWRSHGAPEFAVAVDIRVMVAVRAYHAGAGVDVHVPFLTIEFKCQFLPAVAGQAGIHRFGFMLGKIGSSPAFPGMAFVAASDMAGFAV